MNIKEAFKRAAISVLGFAIGISLPWIVFGAGYLVGKKIATNEYKEYIKRNCCDCERPIPNEFKLPCSNLSP